MKKLKKEMNKNDVLEEKLNAKELTKDELKELRKMFPRRKRIGIRKM